MPLLTTKFYIPPARTKLVPRPRLVERLNAALHQNQGFGRKLTLIAAPAGFGKTTLVSEWVQALGRATPPIAVAWLSLDEGDNDPTRFLVYLITALQSIDGALAQGALSALQSPQPPATETILVSLINGIAATSGKIILVLDDYHLMDARPIHDALTYLLEHLPPRIHLVIATRQDPQLPLSRLRARSELTELREADLRFTNSEAAEFLNQAMGLNLSVEDITVLESRTEGWITGLQLAAISMQGSQDAKGFIKSFTGSHRYVLDYLIEEVLEQQPESIQTFLLRTSILDRMCAPLCDEVVGTFEGWNISPLPSREREDPAHAADRPANVATFRRSNEALEYLEQANLFIVPLDNERRWYRYHHLFADLLRKRLYQIAASSTRDGMADVAEYHVRASQWYEENGFEIEAFQHAAAANDVERAARLIEGKGMPLQFRGAMVPVMNWLASLPTSELDARPSLWVTYASALTMLGQPVSRVEEILQAAEAALDAGTLESAEQDEVTRDLIGQIASIRAMLAIPQNQAETIVAQSRRALEYLHPGNLPARTTATWTLGFAHQLQGDRAAAIQVYNDAISISQASGNIMVTIAAATCLGQVQEAQNQLNLAAEAYRRVLQLAGDPPLPAACEAHLGLARICYQWNDLDAAQGHGQQGLQLARQMQTVDTPATCGVFLARLKLSRGDVPGAAAMLAEAGQFVRQHDFVHSMPEVAAAQVLVLLRQGDLARAADLAEKHHLPLSQARVHLAQGDPSKALAVLEPWRQQVEARDWADGRLEVTLLQALALHAQDEKQRAVRVLAGALVLAEPGGFIRIFLDEGRPMAALLREAAKHAAASNYVRQLLGAFGEPEVKTPATQPLVEPLTERELEVLRLLRTYLKGPEIAQELMVSLNTLRTHTRNIYNKLGVNNRQAAVRRAEELDLL